jgi:hypothetical protein
VGLLPRIGLLSARYRLLIGAVSDPRVAQMAAARGDAEAVYGAGAAARAQADRARISALLRRRGVEIVDAPPDRLPSALADAYLHLKAAGQLRRTSRSEMTGFMIVTDVPRPPPPPVRSGAERPERGRDPASMLAKEEMAAREGAVPVEQQQRKAARRPLPGCQRGTRE